MKNDFKKIKTTIVDENFWEGHEPSLISVLEYPTVFLVLGKTEEVYEKIVNPLIDDLSNQRWDEYTIKHKKDIASCPLALKSYNLDASKGLESLRNQIADNRPDKEKLNIYIVEPFDEKSFQGQEVEFDATLSRLMTSGIIHNNDKRGVWFNTHVIIITEKEPRLKNCPSFYFFSRKGSLCIVDCSVE